MGLYEELPLGTTARTIRLIRLKPAKNREVPIIAQVFVAKLDELPEFTCLSYCWGQPTPQQEIDCNGHSLGITTSLILALSAVRSASNLPLWCDQISINQQDMGERSAQVSLMGEIYSAAKETFVYLGEVKSKAMDTACRVVSVLEQGFWQRAMQVVNTGGGACSEIPAHIERIRKAVLHPFLLKQKHDRSTRKAMTEILAAPFFTRKWVIQEICLSRSLTVIVGSHLLDWTSLLATALQSGDDIPPLPFLTNIWWLWNASVDKGFKKVPLLSLLYYTKLFLSTEPLDAIYSLLGLASDASDYPRPNYTLSPEDIYLSVSQALIHKGQGALVLRLAAQDPSGNPSPSLPSWVVNPSCLANSYTPKRYTGFSAGGLSPTLMRMHSDNRTLLVTGRVIDRIQAIAAPFSPAHSLWKRMALALADCSTAFADAWLGSREAEQEALRNLINFKMGDDPEQESFKSVGYSLVFSEDACDDPSYAAMTLIDDTSRLRLQGMVIRYHLSRLRRRISVSWLQPCGQMKTHAISAVAPCRSPRDWLQFAEHQLIEGLVTDSAETNVSRWRFFDNDTRPVLMDSGLLGLVPTAAQVGDVIMLVKGGRMPILLREQREGGGEKRYALIGEGMVQGMMFGEALQKLARRGEKDLEIEKEKGESSWEEIAIC